MDLQASRAHLQQARQEQELANAAVEQLSANPTLSFAPASIGSANPSLPSVGPQASVYLPDLATLYRAPSNSPPATSLSVSTQADPQPSIINLEPVFTDVLPDDFSLRQQGNITAIRVGNPVTYLR